MQTRLRDGARRVVPIAVAVVAFGVSYGVLARAAGLGAWAPVVMSATTFAGSAQFAAASILHTGGERRRDRPPARPGRSAGGADRRR